MVTTVNSIIEELEKKNAAALPDFALNLGFTQTKNDPKTSPETKQMLESAEGLAATKFGGSKSQAVTMMMTLKGSGLGNLDFNEMVSSGVAAQLVDLQRANKEAYDRLIKEQHADNNALKTAIEKIRPAGSPSPEAPPATAGGQGIGGLHAWLDSFTAEGGAISAFSQMPMIGPMIVGFFRALHSFVEMISPHGPDGKPVTNAPEQTQQQPQEQPQQRGPAPQLANANP